MLRACQTAFRQKQKGSPGIGDCLFSQIASTRWGGQDRSSPTPTPDYFSNVIFFDDKYDPARTRYRYTPEGMPTPASFLPSHVTL